MKRKHKTYSRPKRPFDKVRIDEEAGIKREFGLKNKREIWKAEAKIKGMREKAKKLISAEESQQQTLFDQLSKIGLAVDSIADVLGLEKNDYLNRRLQTVVFNKKLAPTVKAARQMITHKKVMVDGKVVNKPSYIVSVEMEDKITVKAAKKKPKKEEVVQEAPKEQTEEAPDQETKDAEVKE